MKQAIRAKSIALLLPAFLQLLTACAAETADASGAAAASAGTTAILLSDSQTEVPAGSPAWTDGGMQPASPQPSNGLGTTSGQPAGGASGPVAGRKPPRGGQNGNAANTGFGQNGNAANPGGRQNGTAANPGGGQNGTAANPGGGLNGTAANPGGGQGGAAGTAPSGQQAQAYSMEQAMSDNAQLSTIAFSALAFMTGSAGADSFLPPGKVADFFGFQYMRDVDVAGYGHNTQFLTRAACNVLALLDDDQKSRLVALAKEQAPLYVDFAYNRFPLMTAFRRSLEGDVPDGSDGLDLDAVAACTAGLYQTDARLSYDRAVVVGGIIESFTDEQKAALAKMSFNDISTWPDVAEDETLKKSMTNREFVAVMTYASELFSWYKGSVEADAYFCPERHGTWFGGFYLKDYPAMNNPGYFISTSVTGDKGKAFLELLTDAQRARIEGIIPEQKDALQEIADIRTEVAAELRKAQTGGTPDEELVYSLIERYGALDGRISGLYAQRFTEVYASLSDEQRAAIVALRDLDVTPQGAYLYSTPVAMPAELPTDWLFGIGEIPSDAGQLDAPDSFSAEVR